MSGEQERVLEQLFQDYQRQRSRMADLAKQMQEISGTATSPRRELTVTVQHNGGLTDIKFTGSAYRRMAPNELADLIMSTVADAKEKAADAAAEVLAPMLPPSMNARDIVSGKLGMEAFAPAAGPRLPQAVREQLHG
jgi:DNA-binding protein YbaB